MIYIFEGDDLDAINKNLDEIKKGFEKSNIYSFDGFSKNKGEILNILQTQNIFASLQLVVVKVLPNENLDYDFSKYKESREITILLYGSLSKRYTSIKNLYKIAQIRSFKSKIKESNFDLCEAIFLQRNKKLAIEIIQKQESWESDIFGLISLMQTYIRNLISKNYKNNTWIELNPYFKKKFEVEKNKFTEDELKNLYSDLFELDINLKSSSKRTAKQLLLDFVIYSI